MPRPAEQLPPAPPSLEPAGRAELRALTERALRRQRRELADALEEAFESVPRPLRGAVRKALGA